MFDNDYTTKELAIGGTLTLTLTPTLSLTPFKSSPFMANYFLALALLWY